MRLAITGAGGFVGQAVLHAALGDPRFASIVVTDRALRDLPDDPRIRALPGDIADSALQAALWEGADAMLHLAAVPGGAAEADPSASARVNLEATLTAIIHERPVLAADGLPAAFAVSRAHG